MTECHLFFSLRELDEGRVRLTNAWVYWLEQDPVRILYCDQEGRVHGFGAGTGLHTPQMYTADFLSTVGANVEATYSEGPNPLPTELIGPDLATFKVPGWFTPPTFPGSSPGDPGPLYITPGTLTAVRRIPTVQIRMDRRTPTVTTETVLEVPEDRTRRHVGVSEKVTLKASGAVGTVNWSVIEGHGRGTLSATTGESVTYETHETKELATIQAKDDRSRSLVLFHVDCDHVLTPKRLEEVFTGATDEQLKLVADAFNEAFEAFGVNTCLRRAHFFAQVLKEIGRDAIPKAENFNYMVEALTIFQYFQDHPDEAQLFGRIEDANGNVTRAANQEAIANRAYGNSLGNGDVASGDGFRFRGRGFLQVTKRNIYIAAQRELDERFPNSGIDVVANPDSATEVRTGMFIGLAYWSMSNLSAIADQGATDEVVNRISSRINSRESPERRAQRLANFRDITSPAFRLTACTEALS